MKQVKISEKRLKKAEQDITRIVNELFKQQRGLIWLEPRIQIAFYRSDTDEEANLFDKIDGEVHESGSTRWKWIEYAIANSKSKGLSLTLFRK